MPTFETLSENNPYSKQNRAQYKMGVFEGLLSKWGFRTNADKYNEEMDNRANEYEAQLQSTQREEEYNSAAAQAARMRNAGLNPDLAENMPGAGEATEFKEPETAPESPVGDFESAGEHAAQLGTFLLDTLIGGASTIGTLINAGKTVVDIMKGKQDIETGENVLDEQTLELIKKAHEMYGNLSKNGDYTFANGAHMGKLMGYSGKKLAKFAQGYDMLYNQVPSAINRKEGQYQENVLDQVHTLNDMIRENAMKVQEIEKKYNIKKLEIIQAQPEKLQKYIEEELEQPGASNEALRMGALNSYEQSRVTKVTAEIQESTREGEIEIQKADLETISKFNDDMKNISEHWSSAVFPAYGLIRQGKKTIEYIRASKRRYGKDTSGATEAATIAAGAAAGGVGKGLFSGRRKIGFK